MRVGQKNLKTSNECVERFADYRTLERKGRSTPYLYEAAVSLIVENSSCSQPRAASRCLRHAVEQVTAFRLPYRARRGS